MLGYLLGSKVGAIGYNMIHQRGVANLLYFLGIQFLRPIVQLMGTILFIHTAMDRIFGLNVSMKRDLDLPIWAR